MPQQALLVLRYPTPLYSSGARKGGLAGSAVRVWLAQISDLWPDILTLEA